MKVAHFLIVTTLLAAFAGATYGQEPMPDPAMTGPQTGGPTMLGADCYPGFEMASGPVYSDCPPYMGRQPFGRLRQRTSRGYFTADAMLMHLGGVAPRNIATVGVAGPTALSTTDLDFGVETAPRFTAGIVLNNDVAIEGTVFYKDDFDASSAVTSAGGLLESPIISTIAPTDYTDANIAEVAVATGIHTYEVNLVETTRIFRFLSGFGYKEIRDTMNVNFVDGANSSNTRIGTYNHMYGGHTGFRAGYDWELFGIEAGGKAGYYFNQGAQQTLIRDVNNTVVRRSSSGAGDSDSFCGELNAKISYRPLPYLAIQAGYQCYWITGVALSQDQLNPTLPTESGFGLNDKGDLFYHGPHVGMEARW